MLRFYFQRGCDLHLRRRSATVQQRRFKPTVLQCIQSPKMKITTSLKIETKHTVAFLVFQGSICLLASCKSKDVAVLLLLGGAFNLKIRHFAVFSWRGQTTVTTAADAEMKVPISTAFMSLSIVPMTPSLLLWILGNCEEAERVSTAMV